MRAVIAIDPGNKESGYCIIDRDTMRPIEHGKLDNVTLLDVFKSGDFAEMMARYDGFEVCIEMIASYGMPVGAEVFDTCVWIGRFIEAFDEVFCTPVEYIYRKEEKLNICGNSRANDTNIRQALVDRFARGESNYGKGTKKSPGWFYGFAADQWAAYAVGVTYIDKKEACNGI